MQMIKEDSVKNINERVTYVRIAMLIYHDDLCAVGHGIYNENDFCCG